MSSALTVKEAAAELRVHPQSVYRLLWAGDLPYSNISTGKRPRIRIEPDAIKTFLRNRATGCTT